MLLKLIMSLRNLLLLLSPNITKVKENFIKYVKRTTHVEQK